jgi:hypothetical protein
MKFKSIFKNIFKIASKDEFRPAMQGLLLHHNRLTACDGYKVVSIPCEVFEDEEPFNEKGIIIPTAIIKQAKPSIVDNSNLELQVLPNGFKISNMSLEEEAINEKYPSFEKIIIETQGRLNEKENICILSLDMEHLIAIQEALCTLPSKVIGRRKINLAIYLNQEKDKFRTVTRPILVQSASPDSDNSIGLIMPCREDGIDIAVSMQSVKFEERKQEEIKTIDIEAE